MDANCILWIVNCIALNRLSNVLEYCLKTSCIEVHLWLSKLSSHYRPRGDGVLLAGGWETGASQHALRGQLPRVPWDPHPYRLSHCHLLGDLCLSGSHHGQLLPGLHRPLLPALEQVHQVGQGRHGRVRRVRERWRGQEGEQEGEVRTRTVYTLILPQKNLPTHAAPLHGGPQWDGLQKGTWIANNTSSHAACQCPRWNYPLVKVIKCETL